MISKAFKYIPTWLTVDPLEYWVKADPAEQVDLRHLLLFFVSQNYRYFSETFVAVSYKYEYFSETFVVVFCFTKL